MSVLYRVFVVLFGLLYCGSALAERYIDVLFLYSSDAAGTVNPNTFSDDRIDEANDALVNSQLNIGVAGFDLIASQSPGSRRSTFLQPRGNRLPRKPRLPK